MASKISIINMALGWLGAPPIAALTEKRPEAIYASLYYDSALEQTLRDHRWNFAQRRRRLAALDVPDGYQGIYENAYALPVDCLHAHTVLDAAENTFPFIVALAEDGGSKIVLTNVASAYLAYTALVTAPELYDPNFVRALSRRLAADIAVPILKNNAQKVQEAETLYDRELMRAKLSDYREGKPEEEEDVSWIQARTAR
jgi:hypothetical protein